MSAQTSLRIAVFQYTPIWADVERNIKRIEAATARLEPGSVDLICFPEMCFTGYVFSDPSRLAPLLESPKEGLTASFCAQVAHRMGCHVVAGYPELPDGKEESGKIGYNSAMVWSPHGLVHNYRKHNLFEMDLPWASPGQSFTVMSEQIAGLRTAIAICNDLNPPTELGEWCVKKDVQLLIILCAWLASEASESVDEHTETELSDGAQEMEVTEEREGSKPQNEQDAKNQPDSQNVFYWLYRLRGILFEDDETERFVVICNRTGTEHGSSFAGSSTMWKFMGDGHFKTLGRLSCKGEHIGIWKV
ncbi:carbon-nitrogen hydrolase [Dacryopinax primogenitus]|uniref:Carbon-nitrogen hydrolase n=1 Tax=Dacryopinax primogenitus (strain DJM 731) TaxID=1858805 RepID=M5FXJ0_DACPD|nr:carbon-nitrogen hydrolase [Dacryopinax primogenitus]EJT98201.1 carbon-nitrogen hydrolase [Dacryopinax primogenitus]